MNVSVDFLKHRRSFISSLVPSLSLFSALSLDMNNTFLKYVQRAAVTRKAEQRDLLPGWLVHLFVEVSEEALFAGTTTPSNAGISDEISLHRGLHNHDLKSTEQSDSIGISASRVQNQCKTVWHPYPFSMSAEVLRTLGNFYTSSFYTWDFPTRRLGSASASFRPALSAGPHSPAVADVKSSLDDAVKAPMNDDVAGRDVFARPF